MMGLLDGSGPEQAAFKAPARPFILTQYHAGPDPSFHDLDAPPRMRIVSRPRTADAESRRSKLARTSFFEAFAIDAGDDIFTFPKPVSAKAAPKDIEALAGVAVSQESSPMIGIAIGSPSHPPQYWTRFPSANATPRTPRFTENFVEDVFTPEMLTTDTQQTRSTPWKKMSNLFKRKTNKANREDRSPPMRAADFVTAIEPPRPKSRARTLLSRGRSAEPALGGDRAASRPKLNIDPATRSSMTAPSPASHTSSPILNSLHTIFKISRVSSDSEATPRLSSQRSRPFTARARTMNIVEDTPCITLPTPVPSHSRTARLPRLELDLPSSEMERYSVMFEAVLESKSTLLERRKSRLRMLDLKQDPRVDSLPDLTRLTPLHMNKPGHLATKPLMRRKTSPSSSPSHRPQLAGSKLDPSSHNVLPLRRSNTSPMLRSLPLRTAAPAETSKQLPDTPSSCDNTASYPSTPPHSGDAGTEVQVIVDSSHLDTAMDHEHVTNVWQSILPAPPGSSTSSRFSIDIHKALESPLLLTRSNSFNGRDSTTGPIMRQVQVATARRVSISRALHDARQGDAAATSLRPKMIQVGSIQTNAMK